LKIGTSLWNQAIYHLVVEKNEYRLPDEMTGQTVLDIGAHIGAFALACHLRGAGRIVCYEPDAENFALLEENAGDFATCIKAAVMGDCAAAVGLRRLSDHDAGMGRNTGRVDVFGEPDGTACIPIGETLAAHAPVDVLKIDCEGAEWEILQHADLTTVHRIVGELHVPAPSSHPAAAPVASASFEELVGRAVGLLRSAEFNVDVVPTAEGLASFFAVRRT